MRSAPSISRSEDGFGMVSVLVALVLLAVAVVALSSASAFMVSLQTDASGRAIATAIGVAYMEEAKRRPPGSLASEPAVRVNSEGITDAGGAFVRKLTIEAGPASANVVRATVEVTYPAVLGRSGSVRFETIIYRGNG